MKKKFSSPIYILGSPSERKKKKKKPNNEH